MIVNFEAQAEGNHHRPRDPGNSQGGHARRRLMSERLFTEEFLRRLERLSLIARRARPGRPRASGAARAAANRWSLPISGPYVAGDDFRRIDWNAYARLEQFFIKLFVEEEDLTVHFLIDASRSMRWGSRTSWIMPCTPPGRWAIWLCAAWTGSRPDGGAGTGRGLLPAPARQTPGAGLSSSSCRRARAKFGAQWRQGPTRPEPAGVCRQRRATRPAADPFGPDG